MKSKKKKQEAFCVFEGGGAKGVAHIGALNAIQNCDEFDICGYAGTSAGAIVAALAASGYKAEEIINYSKDRPSHILQNLGNNRINNATDLLGRGWYYIKFIDTLIKIFRSEDQQAWFAGPIFVSASIFVFLSILTPVFVSIIWTGKLIYLGNSGQISGSEIVIF